MIEHSLYDKRTKIYLDEEGSITFPYFARFVLFTKINIYIYNNLIYTLYAHAYEYTYTYIHVYTFVFFSYISNIRLISSSFISIVPRTRYLYYLQISPYIQYLNVQKEKETVDEKWSRNEKKENGWKRDNRWSIMSHVVSACTSACQRYACVRNLAVVFDIHNFLLSAVFRHLTKYTCLIANYASA